MTQSLAASPVSRRALLFGAASLSACATMPGTALPQRRFKQALTRTMLGDRSVEECCQIAARYGAQGLDFFSDPADWPTLRRYGLVCSMYRADYGGARSDGRRVEGPAGWNAIGMPEAQGDFLAATHHAIDLAADNGVPNVILLAGTRHSVSYEQGAANAIAFCNQVKAHAEGRGVTLCMENLNSVGQFAPPLSLFDHAAWGFDVVRRVNSPRVKVLYDVFHAQLMDGDIAATLSANVGLIGHIHVGGVPGRHEIDETQELNYRYLGDVIAKTGFAGFIAHEWIPTPGRDIATTIPAALAILNGVNVLD